MAGLSIKRRRKAWLRGVACGAAARGKCHLSEPKLLQIFQKGVLFGQANAQTAPVQAIVQQIFPRRRDEPRTRRPRGRERDGRAGRSGFADRGNRW